MEGDRVFHYQLTIQKLREELALYRNGTDGQELLELLGEKDAEVERLRAALTEKDEKLKKLAKKGAEVIARCDALQAEAHDLRTRFASVEAEKQELTSAVAELQATATSATALCNEKSATIDFLETELAVRTDSVDKLHARCADLLSDKAEAVKELAKVRQEHTNDRASKSKQGKELMEELERAMRFNTEVKERLNREHAQNLELTSRLQGMERDMQALTKAKADAEAALERRERDAEGWRRDVVALEAELGDVRLQLAVASSQVRRALFAPYFLSGRYLSFI
jgi:chromosome segregation ATPase